MQVRQGLAKGLGHAVMCAHPDVGDEPVAVILPHVILDAYDSQLSQYNLAAMDYAKRLQGLREKYACQWLCRREA